MPASRSSCSFDRVAAMSWSIDVSVISSTISAGSTPAGRMIVRTSSTKSGWASCRAEMLTLMVNDPSAIEVAAMRGPGGMPR